MTVDVEVRHPARFTPSVLTALARWLDNEADRLDRPPITLDPFAGTGRVHQLHDVHAVTLGVELETEWAAMHPRTMVGDATRLPFGDGTVDVVATSPCYGNRMADTYAGGGRCRKCSGTGTVQVGERGEHPDSICLRCDGSGRDMSTRHTYTVALGRALTDGNAGAMQWGDRYRALHLAAVAEWRRVLRPDGLALVNMANHVRGGEEQLVVEWWVGALASERLTIVAVEPIHTPRMRHGANHDARVAGERLIVARRLP